MGHYAAMPRGRWVLVFALIAAAAIVVTSLDGVVEEPRGRVVFLPR